MKLRSKISVATIGVLIAGCSWLAMSVGADASPRMYECQHPMTTGEFAGNLENISPRAACAEVRKLAAWLAKDDNNGRLYRCLRRGGQTFRSPVLKRHRFDGWGLRIRLVTVGSSAGSASDFRLVMSRSRSSFEVSGGDFPLNCT